MTIKAKDIKNELDRLVAMFSAVQGASVIVDNLVSFEQRLDEIKAEIASFEEVKKKQDAVLAETAAKIEASEEKAAYIVANANDTAAEIVSEAKNEAARTVRKAVADRDKAFEDIKAVDQKISEKAKEYAAIVAETHEAQKVLDLVNKTIADKKASIQEAVESLK